MNLFTKKYTDFKFVYMCNLFIMIKILFEILFDVGINLKNAKIDEKYNNGKHNIIILDDVDYAYEYKLFWETLLNNPTTRI